MMTELQELHLLSEAREQTLLSTINRLEIEKAQAQTMNTVLAVLNLLLVISFGAYVYLHP